MPPLRSRTYFAAARTRVVAMNGARVPGGTWRGKKNGQARSGIRGKRWHLSLRVGRFSSGRSGDGGSKVGTAGSLSNALKPGTPDK